MKSESFMKYGRCLNKINIKKLLCILLLIVLCAVSIVKIDGNITFRFKTDLHIDKCNNQTARLIKTMPFIRNIYVGDCTADNLDFLLYKPFLNEVTINGYNGDWSKIKKCKRLRELVIEKNTTLQSFENLEISRLELIIIGLGDKSEVNNTKVCSKKGIDKLIFLRVLCVCGLDESNIDEINDLPNLESVSISSSDITEITLNNSTVRYLRLKNNMSLKNCYFDQKSSGLQRLIIDNCPELKLHLSDFKNLNSLHELSISEGMLSDNEIDELGKRGVVVIVNDKSFPQIKA